MEKFNQSKTITTGLIIVNLLLLNWLSYAFYTRFDLSGSGRYRLTSASKNIIQELPEKVLIEAFFSQDVPEVYIQPVKYLRDFLTEYASASDGKIDLLFLNPDDDKKIQARAQTLGIRPMPIGAVDQKKREVSSVYFSLAISYEDKTEVIPDILRDNQLLEYNLTSRIFKMAHPGERKIGFLAGRTNFTLEQSQNPFESVSLLNRSAETFYGAIVPVNADAESIPSEVSVLIVAGVQELSEFEKYRIDQFLLSGGSLIIAQSGVNINFQNGQITPISPDLLAFFGNYGIQIQPNLLEDAGSYVPLRQRANIFQMLEIPYPLWIKAEEDRMSAKSSIVLNLKSAVFPWASSIHIDPNSMENGEVEALASTTPKARIQPQLTIDPNMAKMSVEDNSPEGRQSFELAYYLEGEFKSFFNEREISTISPNFLPRSIRPGKIVALPTPYFLADRTMQESQGLNLQMFLAAVDILNGLEELVVARSRTITNPALGAVEPWMKKAITIINFLLPLALIAGYGGVKFLARKKIASLKYSGLSAASESEA